MKRRALLASLPVAALAGCIGNSTGSGDPTETTPNTSDETTPDETTTNGTSTESNTGVFPLTLDSASTDDFPDLPVSASVSILRDYATTHPARIEFSLTNESDQAETYTFGPIVPWSTLYGTSETDSEAILVPGENAKIVPESSRDCWTAKDDLAQAQMLQDVTLDAGETRSVEFSVLARKDFCLEAGTYRFSDGNYLGERAWGFDLTLTER